MKVAVLLGGKSAERKISLTTGKAIADALRSNGHEVEEIDVVDGFAARLLSFAPEAAFLALHGRWGEDGTIQGMLEMLSIPYTGSGVAASALAMDKGLSKALFGLKGVKTPLYQILGPENAASEITIPVPYVVKPPKEGSTIGITIVRSVAEGPPALEEARKFGSETLIEQFVEARELTVGVLDSVPLPIVEIAPESGFYDYTSKYTPGRTRYTCPAELTPEEAAKVSEAGAAAYRALGCDGAARVDVLLDRDGIPWVIEVNTIPGMTPTSLLPKAAAAAGMTFGELVEKMLSNAGLKA